MKLNENFTRNFRKYSYHKNLKFSNKSMTAQSPKTYKTIFRYENVKCYLFYIYLLKSKILGVPAGIKRVFYSLIG